MTLPTDTVAKPRRAGASSAGCEGRTCDQTPDPTRLDRDGRLVEALRRTSRFLRKQPFR